jgi:hypothetical protein
MNDNQAIQARRASTMPADDLRQKLALARHVAEASAASVHMFASQEAFFLQVVVPVAARTTPPSKLEAAAQAAFRKKAEELAPKYRTAFLQHA